MIGQVVDYIAFSWENGFYDSMRDLQDCKDITRNADKYFKITVTENEPPQIEEVK